MFNISVNATKTGNKLYFVNDTADYGLSASLDDPFH